MCALRRMHTMYMRVGHLISMQRGRTQSWCDGISNSANLQQRLIKQKPREWKGRGLEAYLFANRIWFSSCLHVPAGVGCTISNIYN